MLPQPIVNRDPGDETDEPAADSCSECGRELDLDGYDGRCGNCADQREGDHAAA